MKAEAAGSGAPEGYKVRGCKPSSACPRRVLRTFGSVVGGVKAEQPPRAPIPIHPHCTPQEERGAIAKARHFLESSAPLAMDPYSSALTAYALTLLRSPAAPAALRKLRSLAITQGRCPCLPPQRTRCGASPLRAPVNSS